MAFLKLRDQVGEGRRSGIAPPRSRRRADRRRGPPGRSLSAVAAREAGVPSRERREAAAWDRGPSACQCSPGSGKPTCRRGIAAAATGAGSALAALAPGALPGRRLLFPAR